MNVGDKAPEILGTDQDGKEIKLSDYKGKKIALYFYPKDLTSGCTAQACNLRDNYKELTDKGYAIIGVSIQDEKSHKKGSVLKPSCKPTLLSTQFHKPI